MVLGEKECPVNIEPQRAEVKKLTSSPFANLRSDQTEHSPDPLNFNWTQASAISNRQLHVAQAEDAARN